MVKIDLRNRKRIKVEITENLSKSHFPEGLGVYLRFHPQPCQKKITSLLFRFTQIFNKEVIFLLYNLFMS
jgi:hypothetical protein